MDVNYRNPKIIVIAGKARSGKNTIGDIFKKLYEQDNKKVVISPYTKYLKDYIKEITGNYVDDNNKPREFLQQIGVELIKNNINPKMLINRLLEDIEVYSYFYDIIIISDARFREEIEEVKAKYNDVTVIHIKGNNNDLTEEQKNHITETSLDDYSNYDYEIESNEDVTTSLEKIVKEC